MRHHPAYIVVCLVIAVLLQLVLSAKLRSTFRHSTSSEKDIKKER